MINTGTPRNIAGHTVSGAIASSIVAGAINYNKYKKDEMSQNEAIQDTIKLTLQGGIATGSAIAAANYLGNGNILGLLSAISLGAMGIYATEKISDNLSQKALEQLETTQNQELIKEAK
ncbi:MAG: hypothetical protein RBR23_05675 [Arcobacteraceae bacterium]|jgi:hypothetical protein|nr:hypothetical protein [Arcobacteraceae bacterium]